MSTSKKIDLVCIIGIVAALIITILFMNGQSLGLQVLTTTEKSDNKYFSAKDLNASPDTTDATIIELNGDSASITGNGAYYANNKLYIRYAGTYVLSGELTNSQIYVKADGDDKVTIICNGVNVNCDDNAALYINKADKVFLNLADGTVNTFTCGTSFTTSSETDSKVDGCIYSKDDLTINGTGSLVVNGNYCHGIVCNDSIKVTDGNLDITAAEDGIHANDEAFFTGATINISAGDDGITCSNDKEEGSFYIDSGNITITKCYEGIEAFDITVDGGNISIKSSDDGFNAKGSGKNSVITINDGVIEIINDNGRDADGLDSNGSIYINGGTVFVSVGSDSTSSAIDYGSENKGVCVVTGGTVIACGGSGMAETFDDSSTQCSFLYNFTETIQGGTTLSLASPDGSWTLTKEVPNSYNSVVISTPDLEANQTYSLTCGSQTVEVALTGVVTAFGERSMGMGGMPSGDFSGGKGGMPSGDFSGGKGGMPGRKNNIR